MDSNFIPHKDFQIHFIQKSVLRDERLSQRSEFGNYRSLYQVGVCQDIGAAE